MIMMTNLVLRLRVLSLSLSLSLDLLWSELLCHQLPLSAPRSVHCCCSVMRDAMDKLDLRWNESKKHSARHGSPDMTQCKLETEPCRNFRSEGILAQN